MDVQLTTNAEKKAELAEQLKAFSGLKLLHVKNQVAKILGLIGRGDIFHEYTKHDISHINYMLNSLDWIIPLETQDIMTSADWLMLTLSIYFHDLGMLVSKDEYENRSSSAFPSFKQDVLDGKYGVEYREKVLSIDEDEKQDRFLYQELVRHTHAERIRYWLMDDKNPKFSSTEALVTEVRELVKNLDSMFRQDLAMVCESHHLSDLDNFDKYKTNQPYGPTAAEVVNVHYAALILRTADLLHITSDRTPSIEFSIINPSDPVSQEEWAKQMAVKAVRPKEKLDKEGNVDKAIAADSFEVIAMFEDEKGFFGLIAYLNYADKELKNNLKFNELAKKKFATKYSYPWKEIDNSRIGTRDFDKRQFEFVLDQKRILDLLVGHTLYNDPSVVLRELTQNSIDACRLKKYEYESEAPGSSYHSTIKVKWNSKTRILTFLDNGTGMSLEIIEKHLLKVGSSRYQDDEFIKKYPGFSPISRFGIGLLTCFLIANDVDIITKSADSPKGILLKIRKVHGKYLLKYLSDEKLDLEMRNHGTSISLHVRSDVQFSSLEKELKKWIMFPNCDLMVEDDDKITKIGYSTPAEALKDYLNKNGIVVDGKTYDVKEVNEDGLTMAYALRHKAHWNEWEFLSIRDSDYLSNSAIGTCIEGVRVDFNTPGFDNKNLCVVVNSVGSKSPRTNVARSNIEKTPEFDNLLSVIYKLYLRHIAGELISLQNNGFSLTWAATEASYLIEALLNGNSFGRNEVKLIDSGLMDDAISQIKCLLIEEQETRKLVSVADLQESKSFWSIECTSYSSADSLMREVKTANVSALKLLEMIFGVDKAQISHIDKLLSRKVFEPTLDRIIESKFQVSNFYLVPEQRRLDIKWTLVDSDIWNLVPMNKEERQRRRITNGRVFIQVGDLEVQPAIAETAIASQTGLYILKGSKLHSYIKSLIETLRDKDEMFVLGQATSLLCSFFDISYLPEKLDAYIDSIIERNNLRYSYDIWDIVDRSALKAVILETNYAKYDTTIWDRRSFDAFY